MCCVQNRTTHRSASAPGTADADGRITRAKVLAAALEIIDRDGVDGLSMRRLGQVNLCRYRDIAILKK